MRIVKQLKYINHYRDRHGRMRYYFRRGRGQPQIPLPGEPGSTEFMAAYQEAMKKPRPRLKIGENRSPAGSVSSAIAAYYQHNSFTSLRRSTQQGRRPILETFRLAYGEKRIATLKPEHVDAILGGLKPFAQHNWLRVLRGLMQFCVAAGLRQADPTIGIAKVKAESGSHHTWTEVEIRQYLERHAKGTRAYAALILLLYTGQRSGDMIRMGPGSIQGNRIYVQQQKTGTEVLIPMHPVLRELIDELMQARPEGVIELRPAPFLGYDKRGSFTNAFRTWCNQAGLPVECTAHGLRKAMCRRLAEAGMSAMAVQAITGHKTLAEVERYVREAEQIRLADMAINAIAKL